MWGTDAVHGHNNVRGATIFPHNIGLGAANSPALLRQIGEATALEVAATGIDWVFAPTLAVVRDDRWGRTYEGYSEDPEIVAAYAVAGRLSFDPAADPVIRPDGSEFHLAPPGPAPDLPANGFVHDTEGFVAPPDDGSHVDVTIDPKSKRLEKLEGFEPWNGGDYDELPLLLKVKGKCNNT